MAKRAPRFGPEFIAGRVEKCRNWRARGVRAGHGGDFDIEGGIEELNRPTKRVISNDVYMLPDVESVDTYDLPTWLSSAFSSDVELARVVTQKKYSSPSPHVNRLAQAIKNPELLRDSKLAEHWIQVRLFYEVERKHPEVYPLMFAVPNGGLRSKKTAATLQYEGQKKGIQDVVLALPRGAYHGLFLEVKSEIGRPSAEQKEAQSRFGDVGYLCLIEKGFDACYGAVRDYITLPEYDGNSTLTKCA